MKDRLITLKQLDRELSGLTKSTMPKEGWVRTIRKALGLTIKQLAARLKVGSSRIVKMEMAEPDGAITLQALQSVAESLDCTLVYYFVPKAKLVDIVTRRAKELARAQVMRTSNSMDLELQSVDRTVLDEQIDQLAQELLSQSWKHLWKE